MKIGICSGPENAELARQAGADFLEVNVQGFLLPRDDDDAFAPHVRLAERSAMPIETANGFLPGDLKSTGPGFDLDGIVRYAEVAFARAQRLGIDVIVFGSGGSRKVEDGFDPNRAQEQFLRVLQALAPLAASHGVTLTVEPLNRRECNFITSLEEGAWYVEQTDHANVRLLADFFHMARDDEPASEIERFAPLLAHTHTAEKRERTCPGIDGDDFTPYLRAAASGGYDQRLSLECSYPNGLEADLPRAVETIRRQIAEASG